MLAGRPAAARLLFDPARRVMALLSPAGQHDRIGRALTAGLNRRMVLAFLATERGGDRPSFAVPHRLADAWSIPEAAGSRPA